MTLIYKIQSQLHPERCYIGSAVNISNRKYEHLKKLRRNKHHSIKLQNHYNKHGESDLIFTVLLGCDKEDLIIYEQYFIDALSPWFNICKKAGNTLGIKGVWSEETKKRFSEYRKVNSKGEKNNFYGKHHSEESLLKMRSPKKSIQCLSEDERQKRRNRFILIRLDTLSGVNNPNAKLTQLQIDEILSKCRTGNYKYRELASEYNVCADTIYRLNRIYNRGLSYRKKIA
jgi:group I intron endonuclease